MERIIVLSILLLITPGMDVLAAKQGANPVQAGKSSVYFFDVAATDTHGSGRLMVNIDRKKFEFNRKDFEPDRTYLLHYSMASCMVPRVFATVKANPVGRLHAEGTWVMNLADLNAAGFAVGTSAVIPTTTGETISGGNEHSCALTTDGTAYCWKRNEWGQLGDGTTTNRRTPMAISSELIF